METPDVKGKRDAARRWANCVSADEKINVRWRYLLLSEGDVKTAKGSRVALRSLPKTATRSPSARRPQPSDRSAEARQDAGMVEQVRERRDSR